MIREREQRAAADALGVKDVRFLDGYRDGWLEPTPELQREITQVIRQVRPHRILTSSPDRNWDRIAASHPDHLAAGEATVRAVYPAARNPFAFPELLAEGLEPWTVASCAVGHPQTRSQNTRRTPSSGSGSGAATAKAHTVARATAEAFRWSPPAENQPTGPPVPEGPSAHRTTCRHRRRTLSRTDGPRDSRRSRQCR